MTQQEIATPEGHLHDLDNELTGRLRHSRVTKTPAVPFTGPPGAVCLVMLVFTREEHSNQDLLGSTLDGNNSDDA